MLRWILVLCNTSCMSIYGTIHSHTLFSYSTPTITGSEGGICIRHSNAEYFMLLWCPCAVIIETAVKETRTDLAIKLVDSIEIESGPESKLWPNLQTEPGSMDLFRQDIRFVPFVGDGSTFSVALTRTDT
jgi:hypothetical protein